jgi:short-subunit dehydrogenase
MKLNIYGNLPVFLIRDPLEPLEAATKQYVDNGLIDHVNNASLHLTSDQNTLLDSLLVSAVELNYLSGLTGNVQTQLGTKLALAGGTMTGFITLSGDPTANLHAATKQYVDSGDAALDARLMTAEGTIAVLNTDPTTKTYVDAQLALKVALAGGTMSGFLTLSGNPTTGLHAATKQYVDTADAGLNTRLTTAEGTIATLNTDPTTKTYVDNQDALKVAKAGDTMTGPLVLSADPALALHAATKQYVDAADSALDARLDTAEATISTLNTDATTKAYVDAQDALKVAKAGDTMTGLLTLSGAPTVGLHAATKTYVDAGDSALNTRLTTAEGTIAVLDTDPTTKTYVDAQDALRVAIAGSTMTGALILSADPTAALQAATKQYSDSGDAALDARLDTAEATIVVLTTDPTTKTYVDNQDALKVAKAGDTMTGLLTLSGAPTAGLHAATKTYVDGTVATHAANETIHITADQNTFLDALTVTSTEVNRLVGVTSGVQGQLDSKLPLAGGTLTGNLIMTSGTVVTISTVPSASTDAVNKSYVDGLIQGLKWKDTILESNLVASELDTPPVTPVVGRSYIVGDSPTGGWSALAGRLVTFNGTIWVDVLGRALQVGDRIGVGFDTALVDLDASVSAFDGQILTLTDTSPLTFSQDTNATNDATLVTDSESYNYGTTYTYNDDGKWVKVSSNINFTTGTGLTLAGSVLGVNTSSGIEEYQDGGTSRLRAKLYPSSGLIFTEDGSTVSSSNTASVAVKTDGTTIVITAGAVAISSGVSATIASKMNRAGDTMTGLLTLSGDPTANLHAATKQYVDAADSALDARLDTAEATIAVLDTDPTTKTYVDAQDALKVAKAGDTMTGLLTLSGDPTAALHAATKQYVDAADAALDTRLDTAEATIAVLDTDPTTKTYVDNQDALKVAKAGDTMTGALILVADPTAAMQAATKQYVDAADTALDGRLDTAEATIAVLDTDPTTKTYVDAQDALKVAKAGDTMTGALTLFGAPTANLHATTKTYVDTADAGLNARLTTAEGTIATLNTDPTTKTYVDAQDALRVAISGSTMTGHLTLSADPTAALHAATKQYVDTADAALDTRLDTAEATIAVLDTDPVTKTYVDTQDATKVALAGGTMTGLLTLSGNPTTSLQAATKQYVDSGDSALNTRVVALESTVAILNTDAVTLTYVDEQDALKVNKAGDTMTGALVLFGAPTLGNHAATKTYVDTADSALDARLDVAEDTLAGLSSDPTTKAYVDSQDALKVAKAGDTMTGFLTLSADPTAALHAATKQYTDTTVSTHASNEALHLTTGQNTFLDAVTVSATEVNRLAGVTSGVQGQLDSKVALAGGTMTGHLALSADPTSAMHAATKQYVDAADTALDGRLTTAENTVAILNTDPTTKTYVDNNLNNKVNKIGDSMTGYLTLVGSPTQPLHAVTRQYVDNLIQGLNSKPAVRYATEVNLAADYVNGTLGVNSTLIGSDNGALVIGASTVVAGDRVLVKAQTTGAENGCYIVQQVGDGLTPFILKRVETIDESSEVPGAFFYVYDGALKGTGWLTTVTNPDTFTIGTDTIFVNQFSGAGTYVGGAGLLLTGTTFDIVTASSSRIVVNADSIDLAQTAIVPGSYTKLTIDDYGRATAGSNPTTLAGYGIVDAQGLNSNLSAISAVVTNGILIKVDGSNATTKSLAVVGVGLSLTNGDGTAAGDITVTSNATSSNTANTVVSRDSSGNFTAGTVTAALTGNASTATALETSRSFSSTGDVLASAVSFNGTANVALSAELSETGVTPGVYTKVTVDAKGRLTLGENPTTLAGYGIVDAPTLTYVNDKFDDLYAKIDELYNYIQTRP